MSKLPKRDVRYGRGSAASHCSLCRHFEAPHACGIVAGRIEPGGWCERFARKAAKKGNDRD